MKVLQRARRKKIFVPPSPPLDGIGKASYTSHELCDQQKINYEKSTNPSVPMTINRFLLFFSLPLSFGAEKKKIGSVLLGVFSILPLSYCSLNVLSRLNRISAHFLRFFKATKSILRSFVQSARSGGAVEFKYLHLSAYKHQYGGNFFYTAPSAGLTPWA